MEMYIEKVREALMEEFQDESYVNHLIESDSFIFYEGVKMIDVAWILVEDMFPTDYHGFLGSYLDIELLANDMKIDGNYVEFDGGIVEVLD